MSKQITTTPTFNKHYKERIREYPHLVQDFRLGTALFLENPYHPSLRNHSLSGPMALFCAFSINDDYRVIFKDSPQRYLFTDIGTHDQVYRK